MEIYLSFFAVAFIVLLAVNLSLFLKVRSMSKKFKNVNSKLTTLGGNMEYIKGIELDFSSLEEKMRDEMEQLENRTNDNFTEIEKTVDEHEEEIEELKEKVEELEKAEEQIEDKIETKIDEKMEEFNEKNK
ncbi:MAG: hypothetical protein HGA36_05035 [Candidatus Moranbacteria bacterium]|nr:hypothetical protein [Candidatus Moranbacteria bacterium]